MMRNSDKSENIKVEDKTFFCVRGLMRSPDGSISIEEGTGTY
jgi:hypothetical protein